MSDTEVQAALARVEACLGEERPRDAVSDLQNILAVFPNHPMALCGVGRVSIQLGDNAAALQALDLALEQDPNLAEARNARGAALQNLARLDEAEIEFRRLVADVPGHPGPLLNLAATLTAKNDLSSAEQILAQVLELAPGNPTATYNLGLLHLLKGDLASGWRGFEHRDLAGNVGLAAFRSPKPRWRGEAVDDKTLVILAEQGLGDNIQFARFVPLAAQRAAKVIWEVPEPLVGLFGNPAPGVTVLKRGDPLPEHDLFVPIMSLAGVLRPNGKLEWPGPYVSADPRLVSQWRDRL
ncbi:MAG: tetratricopeptide repeat protein, partial [Alphaproteobacteria bacterium]